MVKLLQSPPDRLLEVDLGLQFDDPLELVPLLLLDPRDDTSVQIEYYVHQFEQLDEISILGGVLLLLISSVDVHHS